MPSITSSGRTGVAISISIVPRSVSLTMATAVIITMVIDRMIASRPGTILVEVLPSGLYCRCTITENGGRAPASACSGPVSVSRDGDR